MKVIEEMIGNFLDFFNLKIRRSYPRPMIRFIKRTNDKELAGVEIGVYHGKNALSILRTLPIKKLYLVDPYLNYEGYTDNYGDELNLGMVFDIAKEKLSEFEDKIIFIKKMPSIAVNNIPDGIDFVYIDGNHKYEYVIQDMKLYWEKLRIGGILGGHDIDNGFYPEHDGIVKAFVEFMADKKNYYIQSPDWWLIKREEWLMKNLKTIWIKEVGWMNEIDKKVVEKVIRMLEKRNNA